MSDTRSVETSAADIETAIELGLQELGVARESVIVEILEEPSRGLLGIGARQARIRLTTAAPVRPAFVPEPVAAQAQPAAPEPEPAPAPAPKKPQAETRPSPAEQQEDEIVLPESASEDELDDDARVGRATLEELLAKMQVKAEVAVYRAPEAADNDSPWVLQIRGRDLGVLIGRRGETLDSLQYITRLIASRELERRANIVLDVEGYKSRREQMLRRLAQRMADQALELGRTVSLEPMTPYERRIVHLVLRDNPDVTTESVGEGEHRKVTIIPRRR